VIPSIAIVVALTILAGATPRQLRAGALALAAGAVLYMVALFSSGTARRPYSRMEEKENA
jgi:hypothetical protein